MDSSKIFDSAEDSEIVKGKSSSEIANPLWLFLFTVVFCLLFVQDYIKTRITKQAKLANKLPGASLPLIPFIGNAGYFLTRPKLKEALSEYIAKYGRCSRLWKFSQVLVFVADHKVVDQLLMNPEIMDKGDDNAVMKYFMGNGLVSGLGQKVRKERRILNPAFNRQLFDGFVEVFNKETRILMSNLSKKFANGQNKSQDIHPSILRCTLECVFQTSLGKSLDIQTENKGYAEAVATITYGIQIRYFKPWLNLPIVRDLTGQRGAEAKAMELLRGAVLNALDSKRDERLQGNYHPIEGKTKPFIDVLLDSGEITNDNDHFDHLVTIVGAGSDTISNAINYTLFLLTENPEYQERVHEELDMIFSDDFDRDVTTSDLADLKYLEMCLKESMRVFPPIPLMSRKMPHDVKLESGSIIPKGADAIFLVYDIHRDESVFPNPEVFDPERFSAEESAHRSQASYIPFGLGLRNCIGQRFAMMEAKVTLAHILRNYKITSPQTRKDFTIHYGITAEPKPAIQLSLTPRR